jgi:hypothetical protein
VDDVKPDGVKGCRGRAVEREEEGATPLELPRDETLELSFLPGLCADLLVFLESCCVLFMVAVAEEVERVLLETEGVLFVEER